MTHFAKLNDPRDKRGKDHLLLNIVAITICAVIAVICEAESWVNVELYEQSKQAWLTTLLCLSNGILSHDTFARVFGLCIRVVWVW